MNFFENVGKNIEELLKINNMSQTDLAKKLNTSKQMVWKMIRGKKAINAKELKDIAEIFHISMESLVYNNDRCYRECKVEKFINSLTDVKSREHLLFINKVIDQLIEMEYTLDCYKQEDK